MSESYIPTYQGAKYHCVHCGKDWENPNTISTTSERIDYLCDECKRFLGQTEVLLDTTESGKRCLITRTIYHYRSTADPKELLPYPWVDIEGNCEICGSFPCEHGHKIGVV